jgi:hypothetical protein
MWILYRHAPPHMTPCWDYLWSYYWDHNFHNILFLLLIMAIFSSYDAKGFTHDFVYTRQALSLNYTPKPIMTLLSKETEHQLSV